MRNSRPISTSLLVRSASRGAPQQQKHANVRLSARGLLDACCFGRVLALRFARSVLVYDGVQLRLLSRIVFESRVLAISLDREESLTIFTADAMIYRLPLQKLCAGQCEAAAVDLLASLSSGFVAHVLVQSSCAGGAMQLKPQSVCADFLASGTVSCSGSEIFALFQRRQQHFAAASDGHVFGYAVLGGKATAACWADSLMLFAVGHCIYAMRADCSLSEPFDVARALQGLNSGPEGQTQPRSAQQRRTSISHAGIAANDCVTALQALNHAQLLIGLKSGRMVVYDCEKAEINRAFVASAQTGPEDAIFSQTQIACVARGCDAAVGLRNGRLAVLFQQNLLLYDAAQGVVEDVQNCQIYGAGGLKQLLFVNQALCASCRAGVFQVLFDAPNVEISPFGALSTNWLSFKQPTTIAPAPNAALGGDFARTLLAQPDDQENYSARAGGPKPSLDAEEASSSTSEGLHSEFELSCCKIDYLQAKQALKTVSTDEIEQLMTFKASEPLTSIRRPDLQPDRQSMRELLNAAIAQQQRYLDYARLQEAARANQSELDQMQHGGEASKILFGRESADKVVVIIGNDEQHFENVEQYVQYQKSAIQDYKAQQNKAKEYRALLKSQAASAPPEENFVFKPSAREMPIEKIVCLGRGPIPQRIQNAYALKDAEAVQMDESMSVSFVKPKADPLDFSSAAQPMRAAVGFPLTQQLFSYAPGNLMQVLSTAQKASNTITQVDIAEFACQLIEVQRSERDPLIVKQMIMQYLSRKMRREAQKNNSVPEEPTEEVAALYFDLLQRKLNDSSESINFDQLLDSYRFNQVEKKLRRVSASSQGDQLPQAQQSHAGARGIDYTDFLSEDQRRRLEDGYGNRTLRLVMDRLRAQGLEVDFLGASEQQKAAFRQFVTEEVISRDQTAEEFRASEVVEQWAEKLSKRLQDAGSADQALTAAAASAQAQRFRIQEEKARQQIGSGDVLKQHECTLRDLNFNQLLDIFDELNFDIRGEVRLDAEVFAVYDRLGKMPKPRIGGQLAENGFKMALTQKIKVKAESMRVFIDNVFGVQMLMLVNDEAMFRAYARQVIQARESLLDLVVNKLFHFLKNVRLQLLNLQERQKLSLTQTQQIASTPLLHAQPGAAPHGAQSVKKLPDLEAGELEQLNKPIANARAPKVQSPIKYDRMKRNRSEVGSSKVAIGDDSVQQHVNYGMRGGKVQEKPRQTRGQRQEQEPQLDATEMLDSQAEACSTSMETVTNRSESSSGLMRAPSRQHSKQTSHVDLSQQLGDIELQEVKNPKYDRLKQLSSRLKSTNAQRFYSSAKTLARANNANFLSSVSIRDALSQFQSTENAEDAFEAEESVLSASESSLPQESESSTTAVEQRPNQPPKVKLTAREKQLLQRIRRRDPTNLRTFKNAPAQLFRSRSLPRLQPRTDYEQYCECYLCERDSQRVFARQPEAVLKYELKPKALSQALGRRMLPACERMANPRRLGAFLAESGQAVIKYPDLRGYQRYIGYYDTLDRALLQNNVMRPHSARRCVYRYGPKQATGKLAQYLQRIDVFTALKPILTPLCDDCCVGPRKTKLHAAYRKRCGYQFGGSLQAVALTCQMAQLFKKSPNQPVVKQNQLCCYSKPFSSLNGFSKPSQDRRPKEFEDATVAHLSYPRRAEADRRHLALQLRLSCSVGAAGDAVVSSATGFEGLSYYQEKFALLAAARGAQLPLAQLRADFAEFPGGVEVLSGLGGLEGDASGSFLLNQADFCAGKDLELLSQTVDQFNAAQGARQALTAQAAAIKKALPQPLRSEPDLGWEALKNTFLTHQYDYFCAHRREVRKQERYVRREEKKALKKLSADVPVRMEYSKLYLQRKEQRLEGKKVLFQIPAEFLQIMILANVADLLTSAFSFAFAQSRAAALLCGAGQEEGMNWRPEDAFLQVVQPVSNIPGLRFALAQKHLEAILQQMATAVRRQTQQHREENRRAQIQALKDSQVECADLNLALMTFQKCVLCSIRLGIAKWDRFSAANENRTVLERQARERREREAAEQTKRLAEAERERLEEQARRAQAEVRAEFLRMVMALQNRARDYVSCGLTLLLSFLGLESRFSQQFYREQIASISVRQDFDAQRYNFALVRLELSLEVLRRQFYCSQRYSFYALNEAKAALSATQEALPFTFSFKQLGKASLTGSANCGLAEMACGVISKRDFEEKKLLETLEISMQAGSATQRSAGYFARGGSADGSPIRLELARRREHVIARQSRQNAINNKLQGAFKTLKPSSKLQSTIQHGNVEQMRAIAAQHAALLASDLARLADSDDEPELLQDEPLGERAEKLRQGNLAPAVAEQKANAALEVETRQSARQAAFSQLRRRGVDTALPGLPGRQQARGGAVSQLGQRRQQVQALNQTTIKPDLAAQNRRLQSALSMRLEHPESSKTSAPRRGQPAMPQLRPQSRAETAYELEKSANDVALLAVGRRVLK